MTTTKRNPSWKTYRGKRAPQIFTGVMLLLMFFYCQLILTFTANRGEAILTVGVEIGVVAALVLLVLPYVVDGCFELAREIRGELCHKVRRRAATHREDNDGRRLE